jgi:predicted transposase/invertase (TIGR01784 family)
MHSHIRQFVSFDWALKKLLLSKANFAILEGFLSVLLQEQIKIQTILESESNKDDHLDKHNKVDLLVKNHNEELIIIEVQYEREMDYLQRMIYGTSKIIVENIAEGMSYGKIKRVISVNIVYFNLGQGKDYVYKGSTNFIGMHQHDVLQLNDEQKDAYHAEQVCKLFPEYYILKINQFNDVAKDPLDEWIYFLKNDQIKKGFTAPGLKEAAEKLSRMKLPPAEQEAYKKYLENLMYQASMVDSSYGSGKREGVEEGKKIGLEEGEKIGIEKGEKIGIEKGAHKEKLAIAAKMKSQGLAPETIAAITGLVLDEI